MPDLRRVFTLHGAKSKPAVLVAAAAATVAYAFTLLPGLDLGDTASFQTTVTLPLLVPRHAYPLYFALGKLFTLMPGGGDPARAMNILSACAGVAAVGAFAWATWHLTGSRLAALWGALMFAFSYTLWSHALIAEVYTLEALFIALTFGALVRWWKRPSTIRLATFYAVYALSFGNHLSMILFAPALVFVLWRGRGRGGLDPFSGRGVVMAATIAFVAALQYAWNFHGLWTLGGGQTGWRELLSTFWFDVTKTDWRESLVGTVARSQWSDRVDMCWWDLRQQFGIGGVAVAFVGAVALARASRTWITGLMLAWVAAFAFAFFYNVGDAHAFLLPSHQIVAMFAAAGAATLVRLGDGLRPGLRAAALVLLFAVPAWRALDTWPAVDRSGDRRPTVLVQAALAGLGPQRTVYVGDLNWQIQNAITYHVTRYRPELPRTFSSAVLWHFPEFVRRNHSLGRDVVLTTPAASVIRAVYGTRYSLRPDPLAAVSTLDDVPMPGRGTPYVLTVLSPLPGFAFDRDRVARIARAVSGEDPPWARYVLLAGVAGEAPVLRVASDRPFRVAGRLPFGRLVVRMDAWLPADTMRRAGFGHIITNGRHALTIERGATFGTFDRNGRLSASAYEGGSFSLEPRYVIPVLK
jgi:hypothetical protein